MGGGEIVCWRFDTSSRCDDGRANHSEVLAIYTLERRDMFLLAL